MRINNIFVFPQISMLNTIIISILEQILPFSLRVFKYQEFLMRVIQLACKQEREKNILERDNSLLQ